MLDLNRQYHHTFQVFLFILFQLLHLFFDQQVLTQVKMKFSKLLS